MQPITTRKPVEPMPPGEKSQVLRGPDPRQDRAVRTRAHILRCAAEIFAVRGYPYTSITDVAQRVGMTKGAVYFHFPNKESLAVAVVEELYSRWPRTLEEVRGKGLSPLDTAVEMFNDAADAFQNDPIMQAGTRLQNERAFIDAELPEPYVDWTSLISTLLREARDLGQLHDGVDPDQAARVTIAAFFGMQHISENLHRRADLKERWLEVRELIFPLLRAHEGRR
ncbi:ScbR family autoregulator-binding transcription factor [Streptomyces caeruleatus]|nr:ScbR family autoregulator-binding transcription factor [Streptomyces caeruleatus]